jgi:4-hydroxybenzoate polyprenyltransferase
VTAAIGVSVGLRQGSSPLGREPWGGPPRSARELAQVALAGAYVATAARPFLHAALNPSPQLTQQAVGGGIRALIPLQAALTARSGAIASAVLLGGLVPVVRQLARKVSVT